MGAKTGFRCLQVLVIVFFILMLILPLKTGYGADEEVWYVHDVIEPSVDNVRWFEEGVIATPPEWIADGSWYQASMRQSLVGKNDIFVSTYEQIDWSLVRPYAENLYGIDFSSFSDFDSTLQNNPSLWLDLSWQVDTGWYGVPLETTRIRTSFNETTSAAELWTWFHITRVPEYFVSEEKLETWLTGFDLTPISTGSLERWEFYEDWSPSGISYELRFEAPANLLTQHAGNYTCRIGVSSYYQGYTFKIQQVIDVNMPVDTEVKEATPVSMSALAGNTATFVITRGETYPTAFTIVSGSPTKSLWQAFSEGATVWAVSPVGWAAIGSLLALSLTGIRGRRIWKRNKTYHRLYKSMVTLYDLYSKDLKRFREEMDNISKSVFKMVVDDRITDDQFERLLKRRDDLLDRSFKQQQPL